MRRHWKYLLIEIFPQEAPKKKNYIGYPTICRLKNSHVLEVVFSLKKLGKKHAHDSMTGPSCWTFEV